MFSCGSLPLAPLPLRLVVLISGSEDSLGCLRLDIWLLWQRSGRLACLHDFLSAADWSGIGSMQHATERVERPGESQEALEGKKFLTRCFFWTPQTPNMLCRPCYSTLQV